MYCYGDGNTADLYGLNTGKIEVGVKLIFRYRQSSGSCGTDALKAIECGDPFGNSLVIVDGRIIAYRGKDSRPTARTCKLEGMPDFCYWNYRAPVLPSTAWKTL